MAPRFQVRDAVSPDAPMGCSASCMPESAGAQESNVAIDPQGLPPDHGVPEAGLFFEPSPVTRTAAAPKTAERESLKKRTNGALVHAEIALDTASRAAFVPIDPRIRVGVIDSIRGFAIFGILWVNVFLRSDPIQLNALPKDSDWLSWFVALTGTLKFRSMFAFLFGLGLAMQAGRADNDSVFVRTYLRRLALLLLFGVMHFVFLWPGDILAMYAVCGMLVICFRKTNVKVILLLAFGLLLLPVLQQVAGIRLFSPASLRADVASGYLIYQHGTFWEVTQRRVYDFVTFWTPSLLMTFPGVFAMMLLGLVFDRKQYFRRVENHIVLWRRLCWGGYLIGIPTNAIFATWNVSASPSAAFALAAKAAHTFGAPFLCIAYLATLVLLSRINIWRYALNALGGVGRMSLTAYLGHSIVCSSLFYGYGLGWFGAVSKWQNVGICFGLCLLELIFANLWFIYFKMGPLEWIWRWATYGSRPAFRYQMIQPILASSESSK